MEAWIMTRVHSNYDIASWRKNGMDQSGGTGSVHSVVMVMMNGDPRYLLSDLPRLSS